MEKQDRQKPTSPRCLKCGEQPKFITNMLDSPTGRSFHMLDCQCGNRTWISEARPVESLVIAGPHTPATMNRSTGDASRPCRPHSIALDPPGCPNFIPRASPTQRFLVHPEKARDSRTASKPRGWTLPDEARSSSPQLRRSYSPSLSAPNRSTGKRRTHPHDSRPRAPE